MEYINWSEKKIPVTGDYDLFIAGGGCAGSGAAIAAGRSGIKTFAAERMFALGGTMTNALMSKIAISSSNHGIAEELINAWMPIKNQISLPRVMRFRLILNYASGCWIEWLLMKPEQKFGLGQRSAM